MRTISKGEITVECMVFRIVKPDCVLFRGHKQLKDLEARDDKFHSGRDENTGSQVSNVLWCAAPPLWPRHHIGLMQILSGTQRHSSQSESTRCKRRQQDFRCNLSEDLLEETLFVGLTQKFSNSSRLSAMSRDSTEVRGMHGSMVLVVIFSGSCINNFGVPCFPNARSSKVVLKSFCYPEDTPRVLLKRFLHVFFFCRNKTLSLHCSFPFVKTH